MPKTKTIKQLFTLVGSPFALDTSLTYPTIEGSDANFLTYYNTNKTYLDRYFVHEYGKRLVDLESDTNADIIAEWKAEVASIETVYLENWARLWYALQEPYNPLYNVDGLTTYTYGEHVSDTEHGLQEHEYGQRTHTEGAKSATLGSHTDTSTAYSVSYDDTTEKETGKQSDTIGAQTNTEEQYTNTEGAHTDKDKAFTDTDTSYEHTDTELRQGNIGVTKSTELLRDEIKLRGEFAFFKTVFQTMVEEIGAYYEHKSFY